MVWAKYGLLTLGRPSVRCYSTLRAWSPVCGSTLRVSHARHCFGPVSDLPSSRVTSVCWKDKSSHLLRVLEQNGIYAVLKNNFSLLEGLEFTPPSSATKIEQKGIPGIYVPTNIFFLIFRLVRLRKSPVFQTRAFFLRVDRLFHIYMKPSNRTISGNIRKIARPRERSDRGRFLPLGMKSLFIAGRTNIGCQK